jgi:invasion protein IalB
VDEHLVMTAGFSSIAAVASLVGWVGHSVTGVPSDRVAAIPMALDRLATVSVYDDWRLTCLKSIPPSGVCSLAQDVVDSNSRAKIAHLEMGSAPEGMTLVVTMPFGVALQAGLGLSLDSSAPVIHPYETCNRVGCIVDIPLDDALIGALKQAKQAQLVFVSASNDKTNEMPISLRGFDRGATAFANAEHAGKP